MLKTLLMTIALSITACSIDASSPQPGPDAGSAQLDQPVVTGLESTVLPSCGTTPTAPGPIPCSCGGQTCDTQTEVIYCLENGVCRP
jgi:hypothetical protein